MNSAPGRFPTVWITVHDVMPETLPGVRELLDQIQLSGAPPPTLLVVPGRDWQTDQLEQLQAWTAAGCRLAGHGWLHECRGWGGLYHRLHGLFFSRRVAEHLERDAEGIETLLQENYAWFGERGLPSPELYVPPAWAMGAVSTSRLRSLPFRYYEYFRGVYDARRDRFYRLPLTGYEADTPLRKWGVRQFNRMQVQRAIRSGRPLRLSVHPRDHRLLLHEDLAGHLKMADSYFDQEGLAS